MKRKKKQEEKKNTNNNPYFSLRDNFMIKINEKFTEAKINDLLGSHKANDKLIQTKFYHISISLLKRIKSKMNTSKNNINIYTWQARYLQGRNPPGHGSCLADRHGWWVVGFR